MDREDILITDSLSKRSKDEKTGYLTIKDCILAGTKPLKYRPAELGITDSTEPFVYAYRPADEYAKVIDSISGNDITFSHTFVDSTNYDKASVGVVINPVFADNQLRADLLIKDAKTIELLEDPKNKGKLNLSIGLYSQLEVSDEVIDELPIKFKQVNLKPNHVALVFNPRSGEAQISDEATPPTNQEEKPSADNQTKITDEATIQARAEELAIKIADELVTKKVRIINMAQKAIADYDGTNKTNTQIMVDVIMSAIKSEDSDRFAQIYEASFKDVKPENLTPEAMNIMFTTAVLVMSWGALDLSEVTEVTDSVKQNTAKLIATTDGADNYVPLPQRYLDVYKRN